MLTQVQVTAAKNFMLSKNFSLMELIGSTSKPSLVEWPSEEIIAKLKSHAEDILQPLRDKFGSIRVTSGYRNPALNRAIGGASNSIHMIYMKDRYLGTATDIQPMNERDLVKVMKYICESIPAVRRIIIYRDCEALGINSPFLHLDRDVRVPAGEAILMEKVDKKTYELFDRAEFENYK